MKNNKVYLLILCNKEILNGLKNFRLCVFVLFKLIACSEGNRNVAAGIKVRNPDCFILFERR